MKKTALIIALAVIGMFTISSCNKIDDTSGKVTYEYGFSVHDTEDMTFLSSVSNTYYKAFQGVKGAIWASGNDGSFQMEGSYPECDRAVIAAAKSAESQLGDKKPKDGGTATFVVKATYWNGARFTNIYEKSFPVK